MHLEPYNFVPPNKFNNKDKINKNNANDLECLSLAIGKPKDVTITSQLLLFREVNDEFEVTRFIYE